MKTIFSPDCPVERLPVLPIHTGLFAQLSNAQVRKLSILNNLNDNHNWFKKVLLKIILMKAVSEGAMVKYGCNGTREVSFSLSLKIFTQSQTFFALEEPNSFPLSRK